MLLAEYGTAMRDVVTAHGGSVEKFIGDAVMAVFGVPVAQEDDAVRAVRAAVGMRESLMALDGAYRKRYGVELACRIGVNTGTVVTAGDGGGSGGALVTGDTVNTAARLEQAATAGQVLVGEVTERLVRGAAVTEPVPAQQLKGKRAAVRAWEVLGLQGGPLRLVDRVGVRLVGRDDERGRLEGMFRAVDERRCIVGLVVGEAGVGKTTLVRAFVEAVRGRAEVFVARCLSYGQTSLQPAAAAVRRMLDAPLDAVPGDLRKRLAVLLGDDGSADVDRILSLLGAAEPSNVLDEVVLSVRRFVERRARRRPLVLVVDDLHWAEPALLDLFEHLGRRSRDAPIVVVATARPTLFERRAEWAASDDGRVPVRLGPLDRADTAVLLAQLAPGGVSSRVEARVQAASEGNPQFVEQLVAMWIEAGLLRRVDDVGRWTMAGDDDLLVSLAEVLRRAGDRAAAVDALRAARVRYDAKGNLASLGRIDQLLSDMAETQ